MNFLVGPKEPLLATVKRQKLACLGHVTRHDSLSKSIGRQSKCWTDDAIEWTSLSMPELLAMTSSRKDWEMISAESSLIPPPAPLPDDAVGQGTELT